MLNGLFKAFKVFPCSLNVQLHQGRGKGGLWHDNAQVCMIGESVQKCGKFRVSDLHILKLDQKIRYTGQKLSNELKFYRKLGG